MTRSVTRRARESSPEAAPLISVVVPCRNEAGGIEASLRSILAQEIAVGFEVIVVDGMSEDGTGEILRRLAGEDGRVRLLENPGRITAAALNRGIRAARGRYIAIMGAHNRYAPDYLRRSLEVIERTGADNVGGAMICKGKSLFQRAAGAAHHSRFGAGGARWHRADYEGSADTVFGGFYRREVFNRIGLFDEELVRNQDDELNLRLARSGGKIWHSPRIVSWYEPRASAARLFAQYMQYGYWKVRVIQKHRLPASVRHLVPGAFVFALIALPPLALLWPVAVAVWLAAVAAYSACNLVASAMTAARSGWSVLPLLPVVFVCYHVGYGYGFLRGVVDFLILRRGASWAFTRLTRSAQA